MKNVALLILCMFAVASCDTTTEPDDNTLSDVIIPLKVGNTWVYERVEFDSVGKTLSTITDTLSIFKETVINNEHWFAYTFSSSSDTSSVINRSDGFYYVRAGIEYHSNLYPCKAGDRFYSRRDTSGNYIISEIKDVEGVSSMVHSGAGMFSCIKYVSHQENFNIATGTTNTGSDDYVEYFAPNKGMIQYLGYSMTSGGISYERSRLTLMSYTLK
jgi:hypothetical protein